MDDAFGIGSVFVTIAGFFALVGLAIGVIVGWGARGKFKWFWPRRICNPDSYKMNECNFGIFITDSIPFPNGEAWFRAAHPDYALIMSGVSVEDVRRWKAASSNTQFILRKWFGEGDQRIDNPAANAQWCFDQMRADIEKFRGLITWVMSWNEVAVWNIPEARNYRKFERVFAHLAHGVGLKTIAFNFPEGNPADLNLWKPLLGLAANPFERLLIWIRRQTILLVSAIWLSVSDAPEDDFDVIGVHEYDAPTMFAEFPWHCGRAQFIPGDQPIMVTECAIDFKVQHKTNDLERAERGWAWKGSQNQYAGTVRSFIDNSLRPYRDFMRKLPRVRALILWVHGWDHGAGTYDIKDQPEIAALIGEGAILPEPPTSPRPRAALAAYLKAYEKFRSTWYWDGKGHQSIGFGHQGTPDEIRLWTAPMLRWQGLEVLSRDIDAAIATINSAVRVPLNDNQWLALCAIRFNIGPGSKESQKGFLGSLLLEKLNAGDVSGAAQEFDRWIWYTKPDGMKVISQSLVERRATEKEWFLS